MKGEDVYDVGRRLWCSLCQAEHQPCEEHDGDDLDGAEYWFEPEDDEEAP